MRIGSSGSIGMAGRADANKRKRTESPEPAPEAVQLPGPLEIRPPFRPARTSASSAAASAVAGNAARPIKRAKLNPDTQDQLHDPRIKARKDRSAAVKIAPGSSASISLQKTQRKRVATGASADAGVRVGHEIEPSRAMQNRFVPLDWVDPGPLSAEEAPRSIFDEPCKTISGGFGQVMVFTSDRHPVAAKICTRADQTGNAEYEALLEEFNYLKAVQDIPGTGPSANLVKVHGIARIPYESSLRSALIMDAVPGPDGNAALEALRNSWDTGKISSAEYWSAVQFIARRLLAVCDHLAKARIVHADIKPGNFVVDANTGEPVLVDFGLATRAGQPDRGHTLQYCAPEQKNYDRVDGRTDVFTVGSTIVQAVEGYARRMEVKQPPDGESRIRSVYPNAGPLAVPSCIGDAREQPWQTPGQLIDTHYTSAVRAWMHKDMDARPSASKALEDYPFLNDSMLDDGQAQRVIRDAIEAAQKEDGKPVSDRCKKAGLPRQISRRSADPCPDQVESQARFLLARAERWGEQLVQLLGGDNTVPGITGGTPHPCFKADVDGMGMRPEQHEKISHLAMRAAWPGRTAEQRAATAMHYQAAATPGPRPEPDIHLAHLKTEVARLVSFQELLDFHDLALDYRSTFSPYVNHRDLPEGYRNVLILVAQVGKALYLLKETDYPASGGVQPGAVARTRDLKKSLYEQVAMTVRDRAMRPAAASTSAWVRIARNKWRAVDSCAPAGPLPHQP